MPQPKPACRICQTALTPFIDFGDMPIGNAFRDPGDTSQEYVYRMRVAVCDDCHTLQLVDIPDPDQMFHDHYAYFASTSVYMSAHFKAMAEDLMRRYVSDDAPFVVEIGCNDGITLKNFADAGVPHLGVDPSSNVADAARAKGVNVLTDFFNAETARRIREEHGAADLFIATNTMHHIEDINSVAEGVAALLKPGGVMVQEDPYLGDMLEQTAYDQLYAEHMYIWSLTSLGAAFGRHGLEIFDVERNHHHGGCMRYFLCLKGAHARTERCEAQLAKERELGLMHADTYDSFRQRIELSRDRLRDVIAETKKNGQRLAGYGATAKSATIINYGGLGPDDIAYISDTTAAKQGKLSPGAHIPVVPPTRFADDPPDIAVLFAWNHYDEIRAKEQAFVANGGRWLIPVRMVELI